PVQICLAGHAEDPGDPVYDRRRGNGAEHQIFRSRFQSERIAPGEANEHVKGYRHQLERDEDEYEIDGRHQIHQPGTREDWHCENLAECALRTGKGAAHDWRIVDHHDEHDGRCYQCELFEEDRQTVSSVKTPETRRLIWGGKWKHEETGEEN